MFSFFRFFFHCRIILISSISMRLFLLQHAEEKNDADLEKIFFIVFFRLWSDLSQLLAQWPAILVHIRLLFKKKRFFGLMPFIGYNNHEID